MADGLEHQVKNLRNLKEVLGIEPLADPGLEARVAAIEKLLAEKPWEHPVNARPVLQTVSELWCAAKLDG